MANSPRRSFFAAIVFASSVAFTTVATGTATALDHLGHLFTVASAWVGVQVTSLIVHTADLFKRAELHQPSVKFSQARAFVARIVKRERPVISTSWRMCPSI